MNKYFSNLYKTFSKIPGFRKNMGGRLIDNYIDDKNYLYYDLIDYLLKARVRLQIIDSQYNKVHRVAIKSSDWKAVKKQLHKFSNKLDNCSICVKNSDIKIINFYDSDYMYKNPAIELILFYIKKDYIRTDSKLKHLSMIHKRYASKTVLKEGLIGFHGEDSKSEKISFEKSLNLKRSLYNDYDFEVDIVFLWVDGADEKWLKSKELHRNNSVKDGGDAGNSRYADNNELRFSMRSIEYYFSDYRKIFIVTDKQYPSWLNTSHPSIKIIDHQQIFEDNEILPVFNSHAIESKIHNIPGLKEHFLYFNDDVMLTAPTHKGDFFFSNGLTKSFFEPVPYLYGKAMPYVYEDFHNAALNGIKLLEDRFGKSAHAFHEHTPHVLKKSVIQELWNVFGNELDKTSRTKFRSNHDVSPISFLYHHYSYLKGYSIPSNKYKSKTMRIDDKKIEKKLRTLPNDIQSICINDHVGRNINKPLTSLLEPLYPIKCEWEID